jgi:hypothetical protein
VSDGVRESNQILEAIFEMKEVVGRIEANQASMREWAARHDIEDRQAHARITEIEMRWSRTRGAIAVATALATALGAGLMLVARWFIDGVKH